MAENTGNTGRGSGKKGSSSKPDQVEKATGWDEEGHPHFGQMRSKYGPNYNPYKFGGPSPDDDAHQSRFHRHGRRRSSQREGSSAWNQQNPGWGGNGYKAGQPGPYGQPSNGGRPGAGYNGPTGQNGQNGYGAPGYGPNGSYRNPQGGWNPPTGGPYNNPYGGPYQNPYGPPYNMPYGMQQFNPNDPNQNPVFGHWDWTAIFSFILSLTAYFCFIALPLGFFAYRRDTMLHMKGRGFAAAAIVISLIEIIGFIFLLFNPGMLQSVLSSAGLSGGSTSTSFLSAIL